MRPVASGSRKKEAAAKQIAWRDTGDPDALVDVRHDCRDSMIGVMDAIDPYVTVTEPTFVARFLLDPEMDTEESVANADVFVDLPDGSSWALTIVALDEVRRLLGRWKETGEAADGSYFWAIDQLIVPEAGVVAMTAAIRGLVRSGEIASVGARCEAPD
jgi:hypothetical protein